MGAPLLSRRRLWWRAAAVAALAACVDGPGGPGRFGEVRVEPAYRAGYEPGAIGVALDTAAVVLTRLGSGERVVDTRLPYGGGALAWVVDLLADEESLTVAVELFSGGERFYQGDTTLLAVSDEIAGETNLLAVAYVGPPRVAVVTVTPASASLNALHATQQFTAEARDPNGDVLSGVAFSWSTSDTAVATVDAGGLGTATGHGSATITATAGGISGSATLSVDLQAVVDTVVVTPGAASLTTLGATQQFTAEARDANGSALPGLAFTWSSSASAVATVDSTGRATATGHGTSTISATTAGTTGSATLAVDLAATVDTVIVTPAAAALTALGATQQFAAEARDSTGTVLPGVTFTWTSAAPAVATVDTTGLATASGHGSTTISATAAGKSGSAALSVSLAAIVDTVIVTPATAALTALGATQQFVAEARDSTGTVLPGVTFTWASTTGSVAIVDSTGRATATGHGVTTISAATAGKSGSAMLTVNLTVTVDTVIVTPGTATLTALGATRQFTAEARDSSGAVLPGVPFSWATAAATVATVDSSGVATATGHGTTTVTATSAGRTGSATLTVDLVATVDTVIVTPSVATLTTLGATQSFAAEARDSNGAVLPGVTFVWATSAPAVAAVDSAGAATATGHGTTSITATSGGKTGSATLTVDLVATVDTVIVTPATAALGALGAAQQFTAEARDSTGTVLPGVTVAWATSAATVATVDSSGRATATGHGTTTISASAAGKSGAATLTVDLVATVDTVIVTPGSAALGALGATQQFVAEARDSNGTPLPGVTFVWTSSLSAVATVDSTGRAAATGHGTTAITAAAAGKSGVATLTVDLAATVDTVIVAPATATLGALGAKQQFTAEARDSSGTLLPGVTFAWASALGAVATVDSTGLATATGHGTTTISATTATKTGTATLAVDLLATVDTVIVTPGSATLAAFGATQQFTAEARDSTGAVLTGVTFAWAGSDGSVAAVDSATGVATAAGNGTVGVTATAGGVAGVATLTVAQEVASVAVTPGAITLSALDATAQLAAEARDANGHLVAGATFAWSSDSAAVTVDSAGLATAVANGAATIAATSGSVSGTAMVTVAQEVASVSVSPAATTLHALGATQQLTAEARDANGHLVAGATFAWSSDTAAVTVDSAGLAAAVTNGTATITATSGTATGTAAVTVAQVVTGVTVTPGTANLPALGATQQLVAEGRDANGHIVAGTSFAWSSGDAAVATVDSAGLVTALANGSATITATAGSAAGTATVTVAQVATDVTVSPATITLGALGEAQQFSAIVRDANGHVIAGAPVTWSTTVPGVVAIDSLTGLATAVANGAATVSATSGTAVGTAAVTVAQVVASVAVTPAAVTLHAFQATAQLSAEARDANGHIVAGAPIVWSSGDAAVAAVDSAGLATAVGNGTATITATSGAASGTAAVTVSQVVASVTVTPATVTLTAIEATQQLTAVAHDSGGHVVSGTTFAWTSDDPAVVAVDATGLLTATGNGAATVTATTSGVSGTAAVTVAQVVAGVTVTPGAVTLAALDAVQQFTAEARDANGHVVAGTAFVWSSDAAAVATIDPAGGLATAAGNGTASITATAGTVSGMATVTVAQVVTSVTVTPGAATLTALDATQAFAAEGRDANGHVVPGAAFAWSSSDAAVVSVDPATGVATAVANGSATVTADAGTAAGAATVTVGQVVASIVVQPDSVTLVGIEQFQQFTATALDANGHAVPGVAFSWSSSDTNVARVNASGLVESRGVGTAIIRAAAAGVVGTATVVSVR